MVFKNRCILVLWVKVASALEGLSSTGDLIGLIQIFTSGAFDSYQGDFGCYKHEWVKLLLSLLPLA